MTWQDISTAPRPLSEWQEDHGDVVWWCWRDGAWLSIDLRLFEYGNLN